MIAGLAARIPHQDRDGDDAGRRADQRERAYQMRLANRVVPDGTGNRGGGRLADKIVGLAPLALGGDEAVRQ